MINEINLLMVTAFGAWLLTGIIYYLSQSGWLLDIPNQRSAHTKPTARGGGLAIVISFYVVIAWWVRNEIIQFDYLMIVLAGLLVAGIGFLDDHRHIPARWRILAHTAAACWTVYWLGFQGVEYLLAIIVLVWCLNLFNFMDGIDAIAGTELIFVATMLGLFFWENDPQMARLALLLAVAVLGFLYWNLPPAKIFMGDAGSGFLGFMLGFFIISQELFSTEFFIGIILFSVFITDATVTLLIRLYRGERWYQAHSCHAYQHQARKAGHFKTTAAVSLINFFWVLPMALLTMQLTEFALAITLLTYTPLLLLAWRLGAGFD
jgi:Fuc2NAc and GlcNAc transferase